MNRWIEAWSNGELLPAPWEFRDPWLLLIALLAPLAFVLARGARGRLRIASTTLLDGVPSTLRARLTLLPPTFYALSIVMLAIAAAGPRVGDSESRVRREGIAIELCVDRSTSMYVIDMDPEGQRNRMDILRDVVDEFVGKRPDDLIGLVTFGTYANQVAPLTLHHEGLRRVLRSLEPHRPATRRGEPSLGQTALWDGVGLATERLQDNESKSKIVILMTDGRRTAGALDLENAIDLVEELGVRVYAIGLGSEGTSALVPIFDESTGLPTGRLQNLDKRRQPGLQFDPEPLEKIARASGGRYFHAANPDELLKIYATIDELERSEVIELRYLQYEERFAPWLIAAACLILIASILENSVARRSP